MEVGVDEMWSVHSYAGDYNPIHDHSVPAITGLAATTWTKVPEQITKQNSPNDGSYNLFGASGNSDGYCTTTQRGLMALNCRDVLPVAKRLKIRKAIALPLWEVDISTPPR